MDSGKVCCSLRVRLRVWHRPRRGIVGKSVDFVWMVCTSSGSISVARDRTG